MPTDPTAGEPTDAGSAASRPQAGARPRKATAASGAAGSDPAKTARGGVGSDPTKAARGGVGSDPAKATSGGVGSAPGKTSGGVGSAPAKAARGGAGSDPATAGGNAAEGGPGGLVGPQLARAALDAALAKRGAAAQRRRPAGGSGGGAGQGRRLRGYSGPGPDPRDPQLFGAVLEKLIKARGWQKPAAEAKVFGVWEKVVGPDIASHCRPIKLADGELTVEAESTAWATQLRLLAASLLKRIAGEVGHNVVKKLHIHGPAAPSWQKGPRRVQGRGPRDTYG